jgi:hypothetical protein
LETGHTDARPGLFQNRRRRQLQRAVSARGGGRVDRGANKPDRYIASQEKIEMIIDAFDSMFDKPQARPADATYAAAPEGRAEIEIKAASIGDVPWKVNEKNPTGACLKLRLAAGRQYAFVFVDLPKDKPFLFKALAAALGIQPDADGKVTLPQPAELVGRTALVEIGHYQTKRGETKATVRKWLPANVVATPAPAPATAAWERDDRQEQRQPPPQQRPANRSRNAVPQYGADDDIPF